MSPFDWTVWGLAAKPVAEYAFPPGGEEKLLDGSCCNDSAGAVVERSGLNDSVALFLVLLVATVAIP